MVSSSICCSTLGMISFIALTIHVHITAYTFIYHYDDDDGDDVEVCERLHLSNNYSIKCDSIVVHRVALHDVGSPLRMLRPTDEQAANTLVVFTHICSCVCDRVDRSSENSESSSCMQSVYCIPCFPSYVEVYIIQSTTRRKRK